jgi:hypothetical protein
MNRNRAELRPWLRAALALAAALASGCETRSRPNPSPPAPSLSLESASSPTARDAAPPEVSTAVRFEHLRECGLEFVYYGNPSPEHFMTEQNGGGVALFDYDGDGWCDVFLANGSNFARPAEAAHATHRLYRNMTATHATVTFADVSRAGGVADSDFGMGVAAGDFDNDGLTDLFLCCYGAVRLWHNRGDGTFEDMTVAAGIADASWAAGAAFADLDDDGDLDLYVVNYVVYSAHDPPCFTQHQPPVQISCGPIGRIAQPDTLWENLGDGTFRNVSASSGIRAVPPGKGLAVEIVDLNRDGRLDVFVANDTTENLLFVNQGGLKFEERGLLAGVALNADGSSGSSMGIACADFDGNGLFDLFVTDFENAIKPYYDHLDVEAFVHRSAEVGLDLTSRQLLSFGTVAADFDLDEWPDLFVANGHIWDLTGLGFGHEYAMPQQLFWNDAGRRFRDVSRGVGGYFDELWVARAAALADLDRDRRPDLVVTHLLRPAAVLRNATETADRQCLAVRLAGVATARSPLGITLRYSLAGRTWITHLPSGGSYAASHEPLCLISTGTADVVEELSVCWSPERTETFRHLPARGEVLLVEGRSPGGWFLLPPPE